MQHKEQQLIHSLLCSDSVSFIFIPDDYYVQKESKTYQKLITPSCCIAKQSPYIQKMYIVIMVKQISLDTWSIHHLTDLLKKGSIIVEKIGTPIILYRQTMEEEEGSYEEVICSLTKNYVIEQLIISGGIIVPTVSQQLVFTLEDFPDRLLRKSKDLFLETVDLLEKKLG